MLAGFAADPRLDAALLTLAEARRDGCVGCLACQLAREIVEEERG